MIADSKKNQTLINALAEEAEKIQLASARLEVIKAKFQLQNPSTTGTALDGQMGQANAWMASLKAVADSPIAYSMISARVPSHKGEALNG